MRQGKVTRLSINHHFLKRKVSRSEVEPGAYQPSALLPFGQPIPPPHPRPLAPSPPRPVFTSRGEQSGGCEGLSYGRLPALLGAAPSDQRPATLAFAPPRVLGYLSFIPPPSPHPCKSPLPRPPPPPFPTDRLRRSTHEVRPSRCSFLLPVIVL